MIRCPCATVLRPPAGRHRTSVIGPGGFLIEPDITGTIAAGNVVAGDAIDDLTDFGDAVLPSSLHGDDRTPPTVQNCTVDASARNPWSDPEVERS